MMRRILLCIVLGGVALLSGCSGNGSNTSANQGSFTGNWQFTVYDSNNVTPPMQGGITGGFLQQQGNSVTGSLAYVIYTSLPTLPTCAGGSAPVTGTVTGQTVTFMAVASGQTYTFTGTLSNNGLSGTYTATDGTPLADGGGTCGTGTGQNSLKWTAVSVAPLTGAFQGSFHSTYAAGQGAQGQDFAVTGTLTQGENTGDAYSTLTGTIQFAGYPCLSQAGLNGTISGSSVILYIIGPDGLAVGSIGQRGGGSSGSPPTPATLQAGATGRVLLGLQNSSSGYQVTTGPCPGSGGSPGDKGNACLSLGSASDCSVPITFSPATLKFPPQVLGTTSATQTVTLTNTDPLGQSQTLTLKLTSPLFGLDGQYGADMGDFNDQPHYTEQDTCGPSPFTLAASQSCTIYISFSPQESCTWDPTAVPPAQCPITLPADVVVTTASNPLDGSNFFEVPVTGTGLSAIVASPQELDFGEEDPSTGEQSEPQTVIFTNQGPYPVQILPPAPTCPSPEELPNPLIPGAAPGIGVVLPVFNGTGVQRPVITCDAPLPNSDYPILVDNCSGLTLQPQQVCTVTVAFQPHNPAALPPGNPSIELNTLQCVFPSLPSATNPCEIDAGRFPVLLTSEAHSDSLRINPTAGVTFTNQTVGTASAPQTFTLSNDSKDSNPTALVFLTIVANGDYAQTNTCGSGLAIGQSCTITVTFTPTKTGLRQGNVVIAMPSGFVSKTIYLRGSGK